MLDGALGDFIGSAIGGGLAALAVGLKNKKAVTASVTAAAKAGGDAGAAGALNGTADRVKRIEYAVDRIEQAQAKSDVKLDGHIVQTAENFREISDRTSNIEGRLEPIAVAVPKIAKSVAKPRKPAKRSR